MIITDRPCVLIGDYRPTPAYRVIDDKCTGCGNCIDVGCPAIHVTRREQATKPSGKVVDLAFVRIDTAACTGCGLCVQPCAPEAIVHARTVQPLSFVPRPGAPHERGHHQHPGVRDRRPGVMTATEILAEAALSLGFDVKKTEVAGMSQRGGW